MTSLLNYPGIVRLLARIASEARHGINCRESRQSCQQILDIIEEEAGVFANEILTKSEGIKEGTQ